MMHNKDKSKQKRLLPFFFGADHPFPGPFDKALLLSSSSSVDQEMGPGCPWNSRTDDTVD